MAGRETKVYNIIDKTAGSNITMQGLTREFGFPSTIIEDVSVFFAHYGTMLNDIRAVYGRMPITSEYLIFVLNGCKQELLADIIIDKISGNISAAELPVNMIWAKAMTWRFGILFGMLTARGGEINSENVKSAVHLIHEMFPKQEIFLFRKPSVVIVEKLMKSVEGDTVEIFENKMSRILDSLAS